MKRLRLAVVGGCAATPDGLRVGRELGMADDLGGQRERNGVTARRARRFAPPLGRSPACGAAAWRARASLARGARRVRW